MRPPQWLSGKESTCIAEATEDSGSIPGLGRSPRGGNGNPLQYSCLENPMDRRAWWAIQSMGSQRVRHKWLSMHSMRKPGGVQEGGLTSDQWWEEEEEKGKQSLLQQHWKQWVCVFQGSYLSRASGVAKRLTEEGWEKVNQQTWRWEGHGDFPVKQRRLKLHRAEEGATHILISGIQGWRDPLNLHDTSTSPSTSNILWCRKTLKYSK